MGEDKFSRFIQQLGPKLYARLAKKNVKNLNAAYRNAMLLLAYESDYGNSPVAKRLHNYGGYGWNGKTYTTFRDDDSFLDAYTNLVTSRYRDAINSADLRSFATNLKKKGYFEDDLDHYYGQLAGMTSMAKAIDSHMSLNPDIYSFASQPIPANLQYIHQPVSTRVATRPEYSYQLPELVVTGNSPKLTLPSISLSLEQAMAKLLLSASGFNPDMPSWELYTPSYRSLVIPLHYEGGKEGILATIEGGLKGRKLDPELEAVTNEKMFNEPRNKNDLSKPLSPVDPVMKAAMEYYTMTKGFKALYLFLLSRYTRGLGNTYRLLRRGNEDVENYTGRSMRRPNIQYADKEARRLGPTYNNSDSPVGFLYDTFLDPLVRGYAKLQLNKLLNILLP